MHKPSPLQAAHPSPMTEEDQIDFLTAATAAAKKKFGNGTNVHSPESIAANKLRQQLEKTTPVPKPSALGKKAGRNGAIDCLRRAYVERDHIESLKSAMREDIHGNVTDEAIRAMESTLIHKALFAMKPSQFIYPVACDSLGFSLSFVARAINQATNSKLTRAAHAHRRNSVLRKLEESLRKSGLTE